MIKIKEGVQFSVLREEIWRLFPILENVFLKAASDCVITCGTDGHDADDPHTHGFAIDLRTKHMAKEKRNTVIVNLRRLLADRYTVLLEDDGGPNEHLHLQVPRETWRSMS